jgi:hypothetical protein
MSQKDKNIGKFIKNRDFSQSKKWLKRDLIVRVFTHPAGSKYIFYNHLPSHVGPKSASVT